MIQAKINQLKPQKRAGTIFHDVTFTVEETIISESICLKHYDLNNYLHHWDFSVKRFKNENKSCFITWIEKDYTKKNIQPILTFHWLVMYKKNNFITIQRQYYSDVIYNAYIGKNIPITFENCYDYIPKYNQYYPIYADIPQIFWELSEKNFHKNFTVKIINKMVDHSFYMPVVIGKIIIGPYKETFKMAVNYWSIHDYKKQWQEGIERLQHHHSSCLITWISEPMGDLSRWLLYKRDGKVIFYYDHFYGVSYPEEIGNTLLTKDNCYNFIPDEQEHLKKYKVKEWQVPLSEFDELKVVWPEK